MLTLTEREAVLICLISGITHALRSAVSLAEMDEGSAKEVYRKTILHMANLDPPSVPLDRQADVLTQAIDLFGEVYVEVVKGKGIKFNIKKKKTKGKRGGYRDFL